MSKNTFKYPTYFFQYFEFLKKIYYIFCHFLVNIFPGPKYKSKRLL